MYKAYERETEMWNQIFKECIPVDLRNLNLTVETMFDEALKLFAEKTTHVLDFGCGTGDISFQYLQYQPTHEILGVDASKVGIQFANETAKLSNYKTATFLEGGENLVSQLEENSFDGVILSNVLDVMPNDVSKTDSHVLAKKLYTWNSNIHGKRG